jgi:hypothetical protein
MELYTEKFIVLAFFSEARIIIITFINYIIITIIIHTILHIRSLQNVYSQL